MMTRPPNDIELVVLENGEDDWVLFAHIMGIHNEAQGLSLDEAKSVELASSTCLTLCALGLAGWGDTRKNTVSYRGQKQECSFKPGCKPNCLPLRLAKT